MTGGTELSPRLFGLQKTKLIKKKISFLHNKGLRAAKKCTGIVT